MRVVVAPDSFKGSVDAAGAAAAIACGWSSIRPGDEVVTVPLADGGEGTLAVIASAVPGGVVHDVPGCTGPDGRPALGRWLSLPGGAAVVELAQVSGLALMTSPDPLGASTRGLGEVIAAALDAGSRSLTIALGGSASTDGGAGALSALGLVLRDAAGAVLPDGGGALPRLETADLTGLRQAPAGGVTLLTDVTNPLLGAYGAAGVYGPQKGASADDTALLEAGLARYAQVLGGSTEVSGAGAAGGAGFGFMLAWGATATPGAAHIATLVGLSGLLAGADVLITGEGRFDATSLQGKVVGEALRFAGETNGAGVANRSENPNEARGAGTARLRTAVVAGAIPDPGPLEERGVWHCALVDLAGEARALADPEHWLAEAGARAARALDVGPDPLAR
ncbi:glycerate kinase [Sanguibacter gelidistatuariae]|uniref:Glycerate kinase n=1 Tax=Sanguibacter gelidistatuariae TaxID=1814289 RepID=A0A1G6V205_9MICO|nr:glycerate kinase [Sanguibacter gelidistatuariae]SDD47640.1 glycerate kinase [Sanguibacter gelidistatuariae]